MAANEKGFVYFDDAEVTRTNKLYKVKLIDEERAIYLKQELVDSIASVTDQDENLIAILIAHINFVRIDRKKDIGPLAPKIEEDVLSVGLKVLLREVAIEELIETMQSLKWHQIVEIITAESPIEKYQDL